MAQIDTFDPKEMGNTSVSPKRPGSYYQSIDSVVPGVRVCEHLRQTAQVLDRMTILRTVNHQVIDEHAFATNLMHTGRTTSGNIVYPSIGSIISHERGAANPEVPAYMLIGYPNVSRGPGFLGSKDGYVYLTDTNAGPAGFTRSEHVSLARQATRERLLRPLRARIPAGTEMADYLTAQDEGLRLAGPGFMRHFHLDEEPGSLRQSYGGEFGQRCLLARRLVQAGVRFIEVSHNLNFINGTGWDTHNQGQLKQHLLVQELDTALSALVRDLAEKNLLDRTLVVVATEFGRPAQFDGGGGRGHQGSAFSVVLAGGGLQHCGAYGETNELSKTPLSTPVSVPDLHATIYATLGVNPSKELFDGSRPVPITDGGIAIRSLLG